ncbi:MAG: glycosyltransferase family 4 protein [Candidatus Verstraetearchaeota archaeon]|nr:glycosyltransferase family 4 protein [Candidatus Verstraetearchaeota archaeon]
MLIGIDGRILAGKGDGIRRYATSLVKHILKIDRENEYIIYLSKDCHLSEKYIEHDNCQLKVIDVPSILWKTPLFTRVLDRDAVEIFHSLAYVLPLAPKAMRKTLLVATFHGLHSEYFLTSYYETIYWILTYRSSAKIADAIFSVSQSLKEEICKKYDISSDKIYVTYSGVAENFKPLKGDEKAIYCKHIIQKYGIPTENYVLYPGGGLSPNKNLITVIKAWKVLKKKDFRNIPLVITRVNTNSISSILKSLDLVGGKDVIGIRWVDEKDLTPLYSCALVSVYPSVYEGFGSPVVEAMACGTPVITSNISAMPEIAGDAALLVNNPYDPYEWAEKIITLLDNEDLREELIKRGLTRAKNFTFDKIAKRTIDAYKEILKKEVH